MQKLFVLVLVALVPATFIAQAKEPAKAAAPPAKRAPYEGPAGLKWGMSPQQVKDILSKKYDFEEEHDADGGQTHEQVYSGTFAGFATDQIAASFYKRELLSLSVVLQAADERPASKRWLEIIEQMRSAYGEPDEMTPVPDVPQAALAKRLAAKKSDTAKTASALLQMAGSEFDALDMKVRKGEWKPTAMWKFPNNVVVAVGIDVSDPNEFGVRALQPGWMFVDGDRMVAWKKATDAAQPREF